jgi:adenine phosphoribosyltransferase
MTVPIELILNSWQRDLAEAMNPTGSGVEHDTWGLYRDGERLRRLTKLLAEPFIDIDVVVGGEARGFLLGVLVAQELGVGFVPARKDHTYLPGDLIKSRSLPDWEGKRVSFFMQRHAIQKGQRVLMVDDWYTTCNQGRAIAQLVERSDADLVGTAVVVDECEREAIYGLGDFHALLHWNAVEKSFSESQFMRSI